MRSSDPAAARIERLVTGLGRTFRELRCVGSQRLVKSGISMTHLHVLTVLRHHGSLPMSRLAETLDVSLSNATGIVDRLEERGLVERVRVPDDRRVVLVRLATPGVRALEDVELVRSDLWQAILGRLEPAQLERFEAAMADVATALEAELASHPERYPDLGAHAHAHPVDARPSPDAAPSPTAR